MPSPKVATYDLQPEMSCPEAHRQACARRSARGATTSSSATSPTRTWSATPAILPAAIARRARRSTSRSAASPRRCASAGGAMIITADHGNLEMMRDPATGQPHTAHTVGPGAAGLRRPPGAPARRRRPARHRADHAGPAGPAGAGRDDRPFPGGVHLTKYPQQSAPRFCRSALCRATAAPRPRRGPVLARPAPPRHPPRRRPPETRPQPPPKP